MKAKETQVEVHPRILSVSNKMKSVTACKDSLNSRNLNANVVCATCNKCLVDSNHFACVIKMLNDVHARTKKPTVVPISTRKPKRQVNKSIATPNKKKVASKSTKQKAQSYLRVLYENTNKAWKWWIERQSPLGYKWVPKPKNQWVPKANAMVLGTVHFGNDQFTPILGYGDLVKRNVTINRVYYVEGLNHNLFSVGQFCDADLEVAFRKSTCFVRDLQGNDLLVGNRGYDLYIISLQESTSSTPLCLMAKATPTQAWLWHRRLSHLNFDYINLLLKKDIVIDLPKLKYIKDQLCSSCELGKAKRSSFKSKAVPSSKGRLNFLHMDLCGPMRVASINGKKYILVIVDDYSRDTWTLFLRSKDETPEVLKDFLTMIQRNLQASVITIRTDRGTEYLNKTLNAFFNEKRIEHQTSTARTPEQNGIVERRNRTLVEAARTMLSASQLPLFFFGSIHIRFDEIKEVPGTSVANNTSGLVPQRQKASYYDNPYPVPQRQDVSSLADADVPSQQELDLLFGPFLLKEEVYVAQPDRFVDPDHPEKVYPLRKALYGLKQPPRAWYDELSKFLTSKVLLKAKYTLEILHKHGMDKGQSIGTPMATKTKLDADLSGNPVDQTDYRSKIGSLMYPTSSRPDIVQASAIAISCNPVQQSRTKHIYTRYHFIKEQVENGIIELYFVRTKYQLADMFPKALPEDRFKYLVMRIGMRCLTPAELEVLAKESA
nr:retrovirus-related Pol polyprotein from transposon TNT 1-94 [Tanacetum cinerariifolium]